MNKKTTIKNRFKTENFKKYFRMSCLENPLQVLSKIARMPSKCLDTIGDAVKVRVILQVPR